MCVSVCVCPSVGVCVDAQQKAAFFYFTFFFFFFSAFFCKMSEDAQNAASTASGSNGAAADEKAKSKKRNKSKKTWMGQVNEMIAKVKLDENGQIPTKEFLAVAGRFPDIFEIVFGEGRVSAQLRADVGGNVDSLNTIYAHDPAAFPTLDRTPEMAADIEGLVKLLWLQRGLLWIFRLVEDLLARPTEETATIAWDSYEKTLGKHHNWFVRKFVGVVFSVAPTRAGLLVRLSFHLFIGEHGCCSCSLVVVRASWLVWAGLCFCTLSAAAHDVVLTHCMSQQRSLAGFCSRSHSTSRRKCFKRRRPCLSKALLQSFFCSTDGWFKKSLRKLIRNLTNRQHCEALRAVRVTLQKSSVSSYYRTVS